MLGFHTSKIWQVFEKTPEWNFYESAILHFWMEATYCLTQFKPTVLKGRDLLQNGQPFPQEIAIHNGS